MRLLVSVRSAEEVEAAWQGGADIVDAKEPLTGSLDPVSPGVLRAIRARLPQDRPLSVALGDVTSWRQLDRRLAELTGQVDYLKPGFRGADPSVVADLLERLVSRAADLPGKPAVVAAAYADFQTAAAPDPATMVELVCGTGAAGLLIDTCRKDRGNLFSYLTAAELRLCSNRLAQVGRFLALGGGLGPLEVDRALEAGAAILGVRGSVCEGGRGGIVAMARVRDLAGRLATPPVAAG